MDKVSIYNYNATDEHYQKTTISAILIEVYDRSYTSDKRSFLIETKNVYLWASPYTRSLIEIKFKVTSQVKVIVVSSTERSTLNQGQRLRFSLFLPAKSLDLTL